MSGQKTLKRYVGKHVANGSIIQGPLVPRRACNHEERRGIAPANRLDQFAINFMPTNICSAEHLGDSGATQFSPCHLLPSAERTADSLVNGRSNFATRSRGNKVVAD